MLREIDFRSFIVEEIVRDIFASERFNLVCTFSVAKPEEIGNSGQTSIVHECLLVVPTEGEVVFSNQEVIDAFMDLLVLYLGKLNILIQFSRLSLVTIVDEMPHFFLVSNRGIIGNPRVTSAH